LLHLYQYMRDTGGVNDVPSQDFLLNAIAFVVYDGGHSMHEALWVANQTDTRLNLNLSLDPNKAAAPDGAAVPTPVDPNTAAANPPVLGMSPPPGEATTKFVSNYNRFAEKFTGEMKDAVDRAMNTAWTGTQRYLEDNSFFAADPAPSAPAAAAPSNPSIEAGSSSSANGRPQAGSPTSSSVSTSAPP